jgi:hypothetical protein
VCNSSELLYLLRSAARIHYGLTELMFGVLCVLAFAQSAAAELQAPAIIQLTGGMYIIVRGLDNVKNGLDESSVEGLESTFFRSADRQAPARVWNPDQSSDA